MPSGTKMRASKPKSRAKWAIALPWFPSVAAARAKGLSRSRRAANSSTVDHGPGPWPKCSTMARYEAHDAPRILNDIRPIRAISHLMSSSPTPSRSASRGALSSAGGLVVREATVQAPSAPVCRATTTRRQAWGRARGLATTVVPGGAARVTAPTRQRRPPWHVRRPEGKGRGTSPRAKGNRRRELAPGRGSPRR